LAYDIENAPLIGAAWEVWETNIIEVLQPSYILSISYKWLHEKKVHTLTLPQYHGYREYKPEDEEPLITEFHSIMEQADHLLAHNGDQFDKKKLNSTFLKYGLPPTKPTKDIDTLKAARRIAKFPSNKLDDLGNSLGLGRKVAHTGKHLWFACMKGDRKSWRTMQEYNEQDVLLLEKLYYRLRGFIPNHPNINLSSRQVTACPNCGSTDLQRRGYHYTRTSEQIQYFCKNCGKWPLGKPEKLAVKVNVR
jgi:predicted RNA-binding Zn-ribbon protein involved in translation (DUF1610 family)